MTRAFTVIDCDQRTETWHQARLGRLTGTCADAVLATIRSGEAAARRDLRARLVCERLTGASQENTFINAEMMRGIEKEPDAIAAYENYRNTLVRQTGFLAHTELHAGCSLDGHVGDFMGIVEVKCPKSATHLRYLRDGKAPSDYLPQITHNLWISGAEWCDFASFDDRWPPQLSFWCIRVWAKDCDIAGYEKAARALLTEVDQEVEALRTILHLPAVLQEAVSVG